MWIKISISSYFYYTFISMIVHLQTKMWHKAKKALEQKYIGISFSYN